MLKRAYYNVQVEKDFESTFEFDGVESRNDYFEYCALYSSFGRTDLNSWARRYKQRFYLLFLLALPLNIPYTYLLFLVAAFLSLFEKRSAYQSGRLSIGGLITRIFTDEEPMNLALLLMLLFASPLIRLLLVGCLMIWAFMMWCEWG